MAVLLSVAMGKKGGKAVPPEQGDASPFVVASPEDGSDKDSQAEPTASQKSRGSPKAAPKKSKLQMSKKPAAAAKAKVKAAAKAAAKVQPAPKATSKQDPNKNKVKKDKTLKRPAAAASAKKKAVVDLTKQWAQPLPQQEAEDEDQSGSDGAWANFHYKHFMTFGLD